MSSDGSTFIKWPDDERKFRLGIGELRTLQERCDAGPAQIFKSLSDMTWRVDYVRETIRLGLIGGGLDPQKALGLVATYVDSGSLMTAAGIAQTILFAALVGDPNDSETLGKLAAANQTDGSASRPSTEAGPSSDGLPARSINAHSLNSRQP